MLLLLSKSTPSSNPSRLCVVLQLTASSYSILSSCLSRRRDSICPTSSLGLMFSVRRLSRTSINTFWTKDTLILLSSICDVYKYVWLSRSREKLPSNSSYKFTVGQLELTPSPPPDKILLLLKSDNLTIVVEWKIWGPCTQHHSGSTRTPAFLYAVVRKHMSLINNVYYII